MRNLILILILIPFISYTQSDVPEKYWIDDSDFEEKVSGGAFDETDIVVVEFWADWNSTNQFNDLVKLKECEKNRLNIMANSDTQAEYNITGIPTVIIFDNGVEKERFNPNIMFQLEADKKTLQNSVDTIILNKFQ